MQRWGKKLDGAGYVIITEFLDETIRRFDVHLASRGAEEILAQLPAPKDDVDLDDRAHADPRARSDGSPVGRLLLPADYVWTLGAGGLGNRLPKKTSPEWQ